MLTNTSRDVTSTGTSIYDGTLTQDCHLCHSALGRAVVVGEPTESCAVYRRTIKKNTSHNHSTWNIFAGHDVNNKRPQFIYKY